MFSSENAQLNKPGPSVTPPTFDDEITIFNNIFHVDFTQCSYNVGALQLYMGL